MSKEERTLEDEIRMRLIASMDLFQEWGKRTYKNTNLYKYGDTSDVIGELAERLATAIKEYYLGLVPEKKGFTTVFGYEVVYNYAIDEIRKAIKGAE